MKVIGTSERGGYIAIVSHEELEKCADKYYGKLEKLSIGSEFDLGAGYNFAQRIEQSCKDMKDAIKSFEYAREMMTKFAIMVSNLPVTEKEEGA